MLRAAPFQPFDIHLADGRAIAVRHPEMVAVTEGGRIDRNGCEPEQDTYVAWMKRSGIRALSAEKKRAPS